MDLFPLLLFVHVLGAIIAFGPSFSMPIIGAMGGKEREHANFATRVSLQISKVQIWPLALLQGVTGIALIALRPALLTRGWLLVAIVLYVIALGYSYFVQTPTVKKVIEMTSGGPPPAELPATVKRVQRGGAFMGLLVIAIVFLMVVKPF